MIWTTFSFMRMGSFPSPFIMTTAAWNAGAQWHGPRSVGEISVSLVEPGQHSTLGNFSVFALGSCPVRELCSLFTTSDTGWHAHDDLQLVRFLCGISV